MINKNKGFSMIEGLLLVVVIGIIIAVSYFAYSNFVAKNDSPEQTKEVSSYSVIVEDESDLNDALSELDQLSIEDSEGSELDTAATSF